jgi:hypothetical protein
MARPIIVTAVTTANGAHFGPGEHHGMPPYSRRSGPVKRSVYHLAAAGSGNPGFSRQNGRTEAQQTKELRHNFTKRLTLIDRFD